MSNIRGSSVALNEVLDVTIDDICHVISLRPVDIQMCRERLTGLMRSVSRMWATSSAEHQQHQQLLLFSSPHQQQRQNQQRPEKGATPKPQLQHRYNGRKYGLEFTFPSSRLGFHLASTCCQCTLGSSLLLPSFSSSSTRQIIRCSRTNWNSKVVV